MRPARLVRALLVTILPACLLVVAGPTQPAAACSCVMADAQQYTEWADTIFVGTLESIESDDEGPTLSTGDPVHYVFHVDSVYEGSVGTSAAVVSARSGASCGLEGMQMGMSYLVFANHETIDGKPSDRLNASLCGGTRPASTSSSIVSKVEVLAGAARPTLDPAAMLRSALDGFGLVVLFIGLGR